MKSSKVEVAWVELSVYRKVMHLAIIPLVVLFLVYSTLSGAAPARAASISPEIPAPANLRVIETTYNSITVAWDQVEGYDPYQTGYWVTYKDSSGGGSGIWNAGVEPLQISNLKGNTEYTISVQVNISGAPASSIQVTTEQGQDEYEQAPLTPPAKLSVTDATYSSLTFSWTGSPGADGYDFYVNGGWAGGIWDGSNRFTFTIPEEQTVSGVTYTFQVAAQHLPDVSEGSNIVDITWGELAAPRDVQAVTATRSAVTLGWAPTPGATSYDIYQDGKRIGSSGDNRYVVEGLTEGRSYTFEVDAHNPVWDSPLSETIKVVPGSEYNIVSYYTSWSVYARGYEPENIDVSALTHINYAFADICWQKYGTGNTACSNEDLPLQDRYVYDGEIVIGDPEADPVNFDRFAAIKAEHPNLKLLISVGGWSWSKNFSNMAATEETRRAFANSVVKFLREYGLDGVDLDWEYPVEGGESYNSHLPEDKENFTLLTQTVREALDAAGEEDGRYYLQTIASGQGDNFVVNANLSHSSDYLDFINIMTYDYSGSWDTMAHANAPLYYDPAHPLDSAERNNVLGGLEGHLNGGVPSYKLVMGIPFYGKGWAGCPGEGQYESCTGSTAFGTWENGIFDFSDIENNYVNRNGYVRHWNEASKTPYLYNEEQQIYMTYNDQTSMKYAASMVKTLDLAGVMSWDISGDRNGTLSGQLIHDLPVDGVADSEALDAPTRLKAVTAGSRRIDVSWDAVAGATGYEIYVDNTYTGYAVEPQYTLGSLETDTEYAIRVLAVLKNGEDILKVSAATPEVKAKTSRSSSGGSSGSGSSGGNAGSPSEAAGGTGLATKETEISGVRTVQIQTADAIAAIGASVVNRFFVQSESLEGRTEFYIPQEVIEAIAAKGGMGELSIAAGGIVYTVPVHAIHLSADIRVVLEPASADQSAVFAGYELLAPPLEVRLEQRSADGEYAEIGNISAYISLLLELESGGDEIGHANGVVYAPETGELRPVPTVVEQKEDGTVTAELKRKGNSLYAVVRTTAGSFADTQGTWAEPEIQQAAAGLIVSGDTDEIFGMNRAVTRAEFTSMIVRGLGILPQAGDPQFDDVDPLSPYAADIAAARRAGLVQGKGETSFAPEGTLTRQEQAAILTNAMRYAGFAETADPSVLSRFEDSSSIAGYALEPLAIVVEQRIMLGFSDTKLAPRTEVTKGQAAVTVIRLLVALGLTGVSETM